MNAFAAEVDGVNRFFAVFWAGHFIISQLRKGSPKESQVLISNAIVRPAAKQSGVEWVEGFARGRLL
jgi:hypothetical protein